MNEEELKKGCGKDLKRKAFKNPSLSLYCGIEVFVSESVGLKVILCPTCQARLEYFQKGKLEERERIEKIIDKFMKERTYIKSSDEGTNVSIIKFMPFELKQLQKEIGDDSQQPRMKQTRGGELKSDEGLHSTDNGSPADIVSKKDSEDICICGHHTKDHSYDPNKLDADLECDICNCMGFKTKEDRSFLGGYAEYKKDNSQQKSPRDCDVLTNGVSVIETELSSHSADTISEEKGK